MCGICGIYNYHSNEPVHEAIIVKMRDVMPHRGPDDQGLFLDGPVGFGHRRLSILDLSNGHQPMTNEDGTIWIVFNGEIYNYLDLTEKLKKLGHRFQTKCDTEVIIHGYESWGEECIHQFQGMFAFVIWDQNNKKVFMARDRIGIKPLYYSLQNHQLTFASEIKSILQNSNIRREIDPFVMDHFFTYSYTPGDQTMFKGIQKLPPGHKLIIRDKQVHVEQYWDLVFNVSERKDDQYYFDRLQELLDDSVKKRLQSDVPLGVFLSGGLDSSAIVAQMRHLGVDPLQTFSVGFDRPEFSELNYARMVAEHYNTDHHEVVVTAKKYLEFFPKYIWYQDEPMADYAAIALYYVSALAREHVTVVLTGEGSDECFAGYERYWGEPIMDHLFKLPAWMRTKLIHALLHPFRTNSKVSKMMQLLPLDRFEDRFSYLRRIYTTGERQNLLHPSVAKQVMGQDDHLNTMIELLNKNPSYTLLEKMLYVDTKVFLPEDLLMKKDKMGMAASIEARVPFLDHRLVEFAATIPPELKLKGLNGKFILKHIMKSKLPPPVLKRRKWGFQVPLRPWFQNELRKPMKQLLTSERFRERGLINPDFVDKMIDDHLNNRENYGFNLFQMMCFETWCRLYLDENVTNVDDASEIIRI